MAELNSQLARMPGGPGLRLPAARDPGHRNRRRLHVMLQDRSGASVDYLAENVQRFIEAASQRPELAGVVTLFRARCRSSSRGESRQGLKLGVDVRSVYTTLQAFSAPPT